MTNVHAVLLRRPGKAKVDSRDDPFWEFGTFGQTGCHRRNLLSSKGLLQDGARLLFVQGGEGELRAVGLTPPIRIKRGGPNNYRYASWNPRYRPVSYENAPILIDNTRNSVFPKIFDFIERVNRSTYCGMAASWLRSRVRPLDAELARQVIEHFDGTPLPRISSYLDAVAPKNSSWYRDATSEELGLPANRRMAYDKHLGIPAASCKPKTDAVSKGKC